MERWSGRVALVTGASGGIGAAVARELVLKGMTVVGLARREELIQELADELSDAEGKLIARKCDLQVESDITEAYAWVEEAFGGPDVVVNNAGIADNTSLLESSTEVWRKMLDINVLALAVSSKLAINSMQARGVDDGHVININSLLGHTVIGNLLPFYTATKWAVTALCKAFQNELCLRNSHISVTSVCPGLTRTGLLGEVPDCKEDPALEPSDVANAFIYALSNPPGVIVEEVKLAPNQGSKCHDLFAGRSRKE